MPTVHLLIKGKVQGVFFRKTAKEVADKNGLTGWVRNTGEGDVEITATGAEAALQAFIDWCYVGPKRAEVTAVEITKITDQQFEMFEVRRG